MPRASVPTAVVVSQGEELLTGQTVDTNANFLCGRLTGLGFRVRAVLTAGDVQGDIADTLKRASALGDAVVCTGGLGPTSDDLTAAAAAQAFGRPLRFSEDAMAMVEERFRSLARAMSPSNRQQAMIPEGAELILNPTGTAPGFRVDLSSSRRIWFLPGVPPEMERMWADAVEPQLRESFRLKPTLRRLFRVMGKGESQLQDLLGELPQQFPGIELGFRTRMPENQVKLRAAPGTEGFESAAAWVRERLGKDCFSEDEDVSLAAAVGQLLVGRGEMLAIAESCTGGWIAHLCVTEPGSSRWLERSWVTYSNGAKEEELGVPARLLARVGAVAEETARKMARGARTRSGAAWGLAVTGIAGPSGGTAEKPIGMVCFAVDGPAGAHARTLQLGPRDRGTIRRWASWFALDLLRRQLLRVEAEQRQAAISADPGVGTA